MTSTFTEKSRTFLCLFRVLDFICVFGPMIYWVSAALFSTDLQTVPRLAITGTIVISVILAIFNVIAQKHLRSPLWIIFIGLYFASKNLMPLILLTAAGTVLDEFVFTPLIKHYHAELIANKAIDKRSMAYRRGM